MCPERSQFGRRQPGRGPQDPAGRPGSGRPESQRVDATRRLTSAWVAGAPSWSRPCRTSARRSRGAAPERRPLAPRGEQQQPASDANPGVGGRLEDAARSACAPPTPQCSRGRDSMSHGIRALARLSGSPSRCSSRCCSPRGRAALRQAACPQREFDEGCKATWHSSDITRNGTLRIARKSGSLLIRSRGRKQDVLSAHLLLSV